MNDTGVRDNYDVADWDCCDIHETAYLKDGYCKDCRIEELQEQVDALDFSWEQAKQRWHKAEAQVKENRKDLLVFAASCAKAQQGLYEDEEFPFTKAELRTKLSFAASFIATMSMDLRHTAIKGEG